MAYFKLDKKRARQRKKAGEETGPKGPFLNFGLGPRKAPALLIQKRERTAEAEKGAAGSSD